MQIKTATEENLSKKIYANSKEMTNVINRFCGAVVN
jgi:hypothetical protein